MIDKENYSTSRTLATVEHMGKTFRIVRKKLNGKPWRKYVVLVYGHQAVSGTANRGITDPAEAAAFFKERFDRTFPPGKEAYLDSELAKILEMGADT